MVWEGEGGVLLHLVAGDGGGDHHGKAGQQEEGSLCHPGMAITHSMGDHLEKCSVLEILKHLLHVLGV